MFVKRIANIAWKEIVQLARAWVLVFVIIGPTLELALIAQTVSTGVSHLPVAIVDQDRTPTSRELIAALDNHQDLDVKEFLASPDDIDARLESNDITLAVIFPAGLEDEVAGGRASPQVQLIADGSNNATSSAAIGAATETLNDWSARRAGSGAQPWPGIDVQTRAFYNPTLGNSYF